MNKINTTSWGEFEVGKLFDIHPTKAYKMTNAELLDGGTSLVLANSAYNNGIGGTSTQPTTEKGGIITFSDTVDANTIFYQENDFIGYSHVQGLYPIGKYKDDWTRERLLFFTVSFRKTALSKGFDYDNKFSRDIASTLMVKLPVDSEGNPDWKYMEEYIQDIEVKVCDKISKLESVKELEKRSIDVSEWGEYTVTQLFDVLRGRSKISSVDLSENGQTPVYSSTIENNGVFGYTTTPAEYVVNNETPFYLIFGDHTKSMFIVTSDFNVTDNVKVLVPHKFNENVVRFITTQWFAAIPNLGYARHWKLAKKVKFFLPTKNGQPDYDYMETYMRNVEKKVQSKINILA